MKTISKKCRTLVSLLFLLFFSILLIGCRKEQAAETTSPPTENKAWERFGRLRGVQDLDEIYRRAEEGDDSCQLFLGEALFNTGRTQIEKAEGVEWIRKAAEQNNTLAFSLLGSCYAEGCGVEQDYAEAVKWFQKGAADGQSVARFQLALCYIEGKGIEKNKAAGIEILQKLAEQGSGDTKAKAKALLAELGVQPAENSVQEQTVGGTQEKK